MSEIKDLTFDDMPSGDGNADEDPLSRYPQSLQLVEPETSRKTKKRKAAADTQPSKPTPLSPPPPKESTIEDFTLDDDDNDSAADTSAAAAAAAAVAVADIRSAANNTSYIENKPVPKRGRAKGSGGVGRKPGTKLATGAKAADSKIKKLREKHHKKTASNVTQLIEKVLASSVNEDFSGLRGETARLRHECLQNANKLKPLVEASSDFSRSVTKLSERLKKAGDSTVKESEIDAALLYETAEILNRQTHQLGLMAQRCNRMFEVVSDNMRKIEAMARFAVDRYNGSFNHFGDGAAVVVHPTSTPPPPTESTTLESTPPIVEEPSATTDISKSNDRQHQQQSSSSSSTTSSSSSSSKFGLGIRVGPANGNAAFTLSTRTAPQIARGDPGSSWVAFSLARDLVSAHSRSQSDDMRRLTQVPRIATENRRKRKFAAIYSPAETMVAIETPPAVAVSEQELIQRRQTLAAVQAEVEHERQIQIAKEQQRLINAAIDDDW